MTDSPHADEQGHEHHGPNVKAYTVIFVILCICTGLSFVANGIFGIGDWRGVFVIMVVSIVKATLVAMFFMHLKYDWVKLYYLVFPVVILTFMMVVVLLPDTVLGWWQ